MVLVVVVMLVDCFVKGVEVVKVVVVLAGVIVSCVFVLRGRGGVCYSPNSEGHTWFPETLTKTTSAN